MKLDSIESILEDFAAGKMVVMMDDEDRENEGDLIMAASLVRPEDVNFMARYARGLICLPMTREHCQQLRLPLMVSGNEGPFTTNFTVSIEAAEGVTTGISAHDRAHTIRTAVRPEAKPRDIIQPGHVFPLMAQPGGVLTRAGHTEAGMDLARLAGLEPAAVLVEILKEDGSMARRAELEEFAQTHDLKIGTVADLIRYRLANETSVERVSDRRIDTRRGEFRLVVYRDLVDKNLHYALTQGEIDPDQPTLVRVHMQHFLSDVLGMTREDLFITLDSAMQKIQNQGGVVLVLGGYEHHEQVLGRLLDRPGEYQPRRPGESKNDEDLRTYGVGAQILRDLGVSKMRVLSAPKHFHALDGFGLEVAEYVE